MEINADAQYQKWLAMERHFYVLDMSGKVLSEPLADLDEAKEFGFESNCGDFRVVNTRSNMSWTFTPDDRFI